VLRSRAKRRERRPEHGDVAQTREHGSPRTIAIDSGAEGVHRSCDRSPPRQGVRRRDGPREQTCSEAASCCTLTPQHGRVNCKGESSTVSDSARCAIYSRFSSERQNPLSIDQQIRKCREHASRNGLRVLDEYIFADEAISGATDNRAGLERLLAAAQQKPRPFDATRR
jgi:hypothetical protein